MNYAPTCSNTQTAKAIIKLTQTNVYFGNTDLTGNGIPKNMQKFVKARNNQFVHLWMVSKHDYQRPKNIFTKLPKKQSDCEHNS